MYGGLGHFTEEVEVAGDREFVEDIPGDAVANLGCLGLVGW
jgi:hypothetical protein